jgi:hypothetical protein
MQDQLGIQISAAINFSVYNDDEDKFIHTGSLQYSWGINKLPTKEETDKVIEESLQQVADMLEISRDDIRITTLGDFGIASPANFEWKMG